MIDAATQEVAYYAGDHNDENEFELAEDTDLNDEELDLNMSRKMSIRALNVVTMHRFSRGSITNGADAQNFQTANFPPLPNNKQ